MVYVALKTVSKWSTLTVLNPLSQPTLQMTGISEKGRFLKVGFLTSNVSVMLRHSCIAEGQ